MAEARAFVLDGKPQARALYEGEADVQAAGELASQVAASADLQRTVVIDVGLLPDGAWSLVELNATWGADLNGCASASVFACLDAATVPR